MPPNASETAFEEVWRWRGYRYLPLTGQFLPSSTLGRVFVFQGSSIKWAKLECVQSGLSFVRITFQDVMVSDFQTGGMAGGALPVDSVCLQFSGLTREYTKLLAQYSTPGWQMRPR